MSRRRAASSSVRIRNTDAGRTALQFACFARRKLVQVVGDQVFIVEALHCGSLRNCVGETLELSPARDGASLRRSLVIARNPQLRDSKEAPNVARAFGTSFTWLIVLAIMLLAPATSYWPLLILTLSDRVVVIATARLHRFSSRGGRSD